MSSRKPIESFSNRVTATAWFVAAIVAFALVLGGGLRAACAGQSGPSLEEMTESLVNLHGQQIRAPAASKAAILARLQNVAAMRHQRLTAAIEADPGAVLKVAVPASFRRRFPAAARRYLEEDVDLDGNLEVLHEDRAQGSRYVYKLESLGQEYSLHFKKEPPTHLTSGARVRIRGVRLNKAIALESARTAVQTLATIEPETFNDQSTIVILVNFRNNPVQPYDVDFATQVLRTASDFFLENSYQQTFLSGLVKGWYTIDMDSPTSDATCNYSQISNLADQAASNAGVMLSNYRRKVYAFPKSGCGWWGLGTIGGNPSRAWINGGLQLRVFAHELGHNLGLYHSHSLVCQNDPLGGTCSPSEYGDTLDTMGSSAYHFNAFQKERLGWLGYGASPPITTVLGSGSYAFYPYETNGSGPKAIKILRWTNLSNGRNNYFYAECRAPVGFDSGLSDNANVLNGFVIRSAEESDGNSSYLLDMSPSDGSDNWYEPALMVGYSFTDLVSGVTITPEAPCGNTSSGSIAVTFGPAACFTASPDISISPNAVQWLMPGGSTTYTISVTNNDSSGCGAASFQIAPAIRSGWTATLKGPVLVIAPGATAQTAMRISSPMVVADGFYSFSATAARAGSTTSSDTAGGGLLVVSSLAVDVSTNKTVYKRSQTLTITATVTTATSTVPNALVALTISLPDGRKTVTDVVTTPQGVAKFKLRTNKRDPQGDWEVQANTTVGGLSVSGATSFTLN